VSEEEMNQIVCQISTIKTVFVVYMIVLLLNNYPGHLARIDTVG